MKALLKKIVSRLNIKRSIPPQQRPQIPLYENDIPNSRKVRNKEHATFKGNVLRIFKISIPTLTVFTPAKPNGMAVIICPGGAFALLSFSKEGTAVAEKMAEWGITVFVLKYRLPDDSICIDKSMAPFQDVQQAMRLVRGNAAQWGINPNRIGIMGFSAGAHVASTLATRFNFKADPSINNEISVRPDFVVLIYPVMSFAEGIAHAKSRNNLTGGNATKEKLDFFSNELHVSATTPASFLVHAEDDTSVPVANSTRYYDACLKYNVPAEIHIYPGGGHGFGMINKTTDERWMDKLKSWLDKF